MFTGTGADSSSEDCDGHGKEKERSFMWNKVVRRARCMLQKPLEALVPHRFVSSRDAEQFGWYNWKKRELLKGFPIGAADTVVDVGCGEGSSSDFAAQCGATVYAVDIDAEAIDAVQRRMKGRKLPRPFHTVQSDANPLPLEDGVATHVLAQEVMEHVDDPRQFLAELVRIGRPGARYLLSVPDPASESLQKALAPEIYWRKPNHLRVFARDEFDRLVRSAGL